MDCKRAKVGGVDMSPWNESVDEISDANLEKLKSHRKYKTSVNSKRIINGKYKEFVKP